LFICGGAFAGLEKIIAARGKGTSIGFGADVKEMTAAALEKCLASLSRKIC